MKRTLISLLLVLTMTFALAAPALAEQEAPVKLRIAAPRSSEDQSSSFNDKEVVQKFCKEANVEVEWIEIPSGSITERKGVILASDLPDAFLGIVEQDDITANSDLFLPLQDLLPQYAPNIYEQFNSMGEQVWNICTWPDGNVYALPGNWMLATGNVVERQPMINQKWLENVGKKMPTTLDELYDVLKAFKEQDANGNGDPSDELPISCRPEDFIYFGGSWGFTNDFYRIEDGKVIGVAATEDYRAFLEFYNKLASEGLLDVESFSQTNDQWSAKFKGNRLGISWCWRPGTDLAGSECQKDFVSYLPVMAEGCEGRPAVPGSKTKFTGILVALAITTACKNPEAVLRFWDNASATTEQKMIFSQGFEGYTWGWDDAGRPIEFDVPAELDPENKGRAWWRFNLSAIDNVLPLILPHEQSYYPSDAFDPQAKYNLAMDVWEYVADQEESMPLRIVDAETLEEKTMIEPDLKNYLTSFVANSVINGVTDKSWAKHLEELEKYQYSDYIEWQQKYYDGSF